MTVTESGRIFALSQEHWYKIPFSRLYCVDSATGAARRLATLWLIRPTAIAWSDEYDCCALTYNGLLLPNTTSVGGLLLAKSSPSLAIKLQLKFLLHLLAGWAAILVLILESILACSTMSGSPRRRLRYLVEDFQRRANDRLNNRGFGRYWSWPTFVQIEAPSDGDRLPRLLVATATGLYQGVWGQYPRQYEEIQGGLMNCVHFSRSTTNSDEFLVCEGYLHYPSLYEQGKGLGAIWRWKRKQNAWTLAYGFLAGAGAAVPLAHHHNAFVFIASENDEVLKAWHHPGGGAALLPVGGLDQPEQVESMPDGSLLFRDSEGLKRLVL